MWTKPISEFPANGDICGNLIESDHAALKRIINPAKGFHSLRTAEPTIQAIEAFRTIKRGDLLTHPGNAAAEVRLINSLHVK